MLVLLAAPLALRGDRLVATPLAHVRRPLLTRMATPFGPDSLADAAIAQPSLSEAEGWSMSSLFGGGLNSVESVRLAADGASAVVHDSMGVDHSIAVFPDSVPMLLDRFQQARRAAASRDRIPAASTAHTAPHLGDHGHAALPPPPHSGGSAL